MLSSLQDKIGKLKSNYKLIKGVEDTLQSVIRDSSLSESDKKSLESTVNEFISVYEENLNSFKVDET
ncbi:hypothetical protein ACFL6P_08740 [Candidatus Latescibacterota bacterium]